MNCCKHTLTSWYVVKMKLAYILVIRVGIFGRNWSKETKKAARAALLRIFIPVRKAISGSDLIVKANQFLAFLPEAFLCCLIKSVSRHFGI